MLTINYDRKIFTKGVVAAKLQWVSKAEDRGLFLHSPYIGVYDINFSNSEKADFIKTVLGIPTSMEKLKDEIVALPYIEKEWKTASDPFNFLIIQACIATYKNEQDKKHRAKIIHGFIWILLVKLFSNRHNYYFKFKPKMGVIRATFENLTMKSNIKRLGNWDAVFNMIADDEVVKFKDAIPANTSNILSVINRKTESMLQSYYRELVRVTEEKEGVVEEAPKSDLGGEVKLKDSSGDSKRARLLGIYGTDDFYIQPIVRVTNSIVPGVESIAVALLDRDNLKRHEKLWPKILEHSVYTMDNYLRNNGYNVADTSTFEEMMVNYIGYVRSSRNSNASLSIIRKHLTKYIKKIKPSIGQNALSKCRVWLAVYLFLLALEQ